MTTLEQILNTNTNRINLMELISNRIKENNDIDSYNISINSLVYLNRLQTDIDEVKYLLKYLTGYKIGINIILNMLNKKEICDDNLKEIKKIVEDICKDPCIYSEEVLYNCCDECEPGSCCE